ncbi:UPF0348 protein family [Gracilibacillus boraciitolerans JCM 21714]|uniref:UPF0348 protein family n=1 Tax=Gracilibacillus boraciitolerans JCM 21714 TaxID=1298598 RepID=W4VG64_9BACI|nr:UPF0348 protein family [Gracilibacillus boraciitolerans JCM 21714]
MLNNGESYPKANELAFNKIGGNKLLIDFTKPNNILGYQYVKSIYDIDSKIVPITIKRIKNDFHDSEIKDSIASATSIRNQLFHENEENIIQAVPYKSKEILDNYRLNYGAWHYWQNYFTILKYRVLTMSRSELKKIHGMKEGLENRIIEKISKATNFNEFMELVKTKRYTKTSLQRIFANILTNTTSTEIKHLIAQEQPDGIRVLAMSPIGRQWLNQHKQQIETTIFTSNKKPYPYQTMDERIDNAYYSILPIPVQQRLLKQSYQKPIFKTSQ